jgi:hypothetical protein
MVRPRPTTAGEKWGVRMRRSAVAVGAVLILVCSMSASPAWAKSKAPTVQGLEAQIAGLQKQLTADQAELAKLQGNKPSSAQRQVAGTAVTVGAGNYTVPNGVTPGLYNVTPGAGQSGNFIVQGTDSYNEILGGADGLGVSSVRARLTAGDQVQISSLSAVTFTPVSAPFVTTHTTVTLGAGTWVVGQDVGAGSYDATPGSGQSGNFIIDAENVNEILGGADGLGVPSVHFMVKNGDVINISGLSQVTLTAN